MCWPLELELSVFRYHLMKGTPDYYPTADRAPYQRTSYAVAGAAPQSITRQKAKFCANCRKALQADDRFCPYCGETIRPIVHTTEAGRAISTIAACSCLTILRDTDEYCPSCGIRKGQRR